MSHYLVAVFTDGNKTVDELLAPYNESMAVPHYTSKEELIRKERERIEYYKYVVDEFPKELEWSDEECYKNAVRFESPENICDDGSVFGLYNPNGK